MKKLIIIVLFLASVQAFAQLPVDYYNGIEQKKGDALKTALHEIIAENHRALNYRAAWDALRQADQDPENADNVILVYSGVSRDRMHQDKGTDPSAYEKLDYVRNDAWNREHVWSKSHGNFGTETGAGSDLHNLKPIDVNVNESKGYKDFDNGGTPDSEATACNKTTDTWEPRDEVKGDVARIIFYMAVRYEGTNGEIDLEIVDEVGTYPASEYGKLSTLLEWHKNDPPDNFERHRNDVIFKWQKNRNPFIDYPELAGMIWETQDANVIQFSNATQNPTFVTTNDAVTISTNVAKNGGTITEVTLHYGTDYDNLSSQIAMTTNDDKYTAEIPKQAIENDTIFVKIEATDGTTTNILKASYFVNAVYDDSQTIKPISDIQGTGSASPLKDQKNITFTGIVTRNIGEGYYVQDKTGARNGIYVYDIARNPDVGDSVIITGEVVEYYDLTEIKVENFYLIAKNKPLPEPVTIKTSEVSHEDYEGVYIKILGAICTDDELSYGMWEVDDGSGACKIHNTNFFETEPVKGKLYDIEGILTYTYSEFKVDIAQTTDVIESEDVYPPFVASLTMLDVNTLELIFSEDVTKESGENTANYSINNGIEITNISQHAFQASKVIISIKNTTVGSHSLVLNNISDKNGNKIENDTVKFTSLQNNIDRIDQETKLVIAPNPVKNEISIRLKALNNQTTDLKLLNINGQLILKQTKQINSGLNQIVWPVPKLTSGTYLLKTVIDNQIYQQKIIIK